jgi:PKD repeat protein
MTEDEGRSPPSRSGAASDVDRRTFVLTTGASVLGATGVGTATGDGRIGDGQLQTVQDAPWADVDYEGEQLGVPTEQDVTLSGTTNFSLFDEEIDIYVDSVDGEEPPFSRVAEGVIVEPPEPNEEFSVWETEFDFSGVLDWRDLEVTIELTETGEDITEDGPVPGRTVPGFVEFDIDRPVPVPEYETTFDASATGGAVESYQWDFGDGETATGEVVTHVYSEAGTYELELTVQRPDTENVQTEVREFGVPAKWAEVERDGDALEVPRLPNVPVSGTTNLDSDEAMDFTALSEPSEATPFLREVKGMSVLETAADEPNEWVAVIDLHETRDGVEIVPGTEFVLDITRSEDGTTLAKDIPGVVTEVDGRGTASGSLTTAGEGYQGVDVAFYENGERTGTARTNGEGVYAEILPAGSYEAVPEDDRFAPTSTDVTVQSGETTVPGVELRPPSLPGADSPPKQAAAFPDDGLYEVVTGEGEFSVLDVQALFDNLGAGPVQDGAWAYNFSGTDPERVNIFDVQALFTRLQSAD